VPDRVALRQFAREADVAASTVSDAVRAGHIQQFSDGIDRASADAWLESYRARSDAIRMGGPNRQRQLDAQALAAATSIGKLRRQLRELQTATLRRDEAEAARARRRVRLAAAVGNLPVWATAAWQ